jgi:hypothetical protein
MASRFQVLQMALDEVAKRAPKVVDAVGDVAKKVDLDSAKQAVQRVADDVVEAADDWGWKGGKPGEVTGKHWDADNRKYDYVRETAREQLEKHAAKNPSSSIADNWKTLNQMLPASKYIDEPTANIMGDFELLESAGIPREWTGKVLDSLYRYGKQVVDSPGLNLRRIGDTRMPNTLALFGPGGRSGIVSVAEKLSDAMRPLTNEQRETFLALLPEWTESLDDLVNAVKTF